MKLTKAILKDRSIHNPHNFCTTGRGKIYVGYSPQDTGRAGRSAKWRVIGPGIKTDPQAHFMDNGCKTFHVHPMNAETHHAAKERARLEAIAWATEHYGITEWVRDPFGDYQAKETMERVIAFCKNGR